MKTVWVNGCFDILHPGHIELFKIAKSLGDRLIVGIDTDEKIKHDKGPKRPINALSFRKTMLESIRYIDVVVAFDTNEELSGLIELYSPDVLIVGSDWKRGKVVGSEHAKSVRFLNRVGSYSTTEIIRKIKNEFK
jgi:D-beta-D-heptose 7-phosphate kinase/D-beta-D-heptose 1-phosphate adenosyltransferase